MEILTNKKIREYLGHSEQTGEFAKYCGISKVALYKRLAKEGIVDNLTNQFIDFIFTILDSGGYFGMNKTKTTRLERHEINVLAHQKAQEEIKKWWEENKYRKSTLKAQEKKIQELEKREKEALEHLKSFGI